MAFISGRFDPIIVVDPEVKNLYRIRDNDENYKNTPSLLVDLRTFGNTNSDNYFVNEAKKFYIKPSDPIWLRMTEKERIENGLPTRHKLIESSMYGYAIATLYTAFAMSMFSRIYYPGGIILRNQRKEGVFRYLQKRLPMTALFFYALWSLRGKQLGYNIDFYSDEEDQIEKMFDDIVVQKRI